MSDCPQTVFDIKADFSKSSGSYLYDRKRSESFLDVHSMYSSVPLGYNHPIFDQSFIEKITAIVHVKPATGVTESQEFEEFFTSFRKYCFSEYVHFACTGALAVEAAVKCALEYKMKSDPMIFSVSESFHGINCWGLLTDRCYHSEERLRYSPPSPWRSATLEKIIEILEGPDDNLAAVIIEPILCTAGDHYLDPEMLRHVRDRCRSRDVCFIVDEIQTGFGATGSMWYSDKLNLEPDILIFGKKAQVSGIIATEKYSKCITSSAKKLAVTFDGDLVDMVRATFILKAYEEQDLIERVNTTSLWFREILEPRALNYRSSGHLIGFDFDTENMRERFVRLCFQNRLLCNRAGNRTVRMRPHLAVTDTEVNHFSEIMNRVWSQL